MSNVCTGQPTRGGIQKSDQNPHHPPKGGVNENETVLNQCCSLANYILRTPILLSPCLVHHYNLKHIHR